MTQQKDTNPKDALAGDKVPLDLVPMTAIALGALAHLDGATKYGRWNWRISGVRASIYLGALRRHIAAWENGEENASDGVPHLGHALACLNILVDAQAVGKLTDDRPPSFDFTGWMKSTITPWVARIKERYKDRDVPKHYTIADTESPLVNHIRDNAGKRITDWDSLRENAKRISELINRRGPCPAPDHHLASDPHHVFCSPPPGPHGEDKTCRYEADLGIHLGTDDKTKATCENKFANLGNFPGEIRVPTPHRPTIRTRLYIAGPMRGHRDFNFPLFKAAARYLRLAGYGVVSPAEHDVSIGFDTKTGDGDAQFKKSIGWDMEQILASDGIALLDGWQESKGASLEAAVAHHAGKKLYRVSQDCNGRWSMTYCTLLHDPSIKHGAMQKYFMGQAPFGEGVK